MVDELLFSRCKFIDRISEVYLYQSFDYIIFIQMNRYTGGHPIPRILYIRIALIFAKYTIAYKLVKVNVTLGGLILSPTFPKCT